VQRVPYDTEIRRADRTAFRALLKAWDCPMLEPTFGATPDDFPDAWHLRASRAPDFTRALAASFAQWSGKPLHAMVRPGAVLGAEPVDGVEEYGFHGVERDTEGVPSRWTRGRALLLIPHRPIPPALSVSVTAAHRLVLRFITGAPTHLEIRADGCTLLTEQLPAGDWGRVLTLPQISPAVGRRGGLLRLEILSNTFVPHVLHPTSSDRRSLGVKIRSVLFIP